MKFLRTTFLIALGAFCMNPGASANGFEKVMGETLAKYGACKSSDDYASLSSNFERIARKDSAEWLPRYYQVHTLVIASFMSQDPTQKEALLDRAEPTMKSLLAMQANNAEVLVLQGMFYTARLVVDPANRGQKYSMLSGQSVGKASVIDPDNPRVKYMRISNGMGQAQFFGQDISVYCTQAKEAVKEFDDYPVESAIHPAWGKDLLQEQAGACNR